MKRKTDIYKNIIDKENLKLAAKDAVKNSKRKNKKTLEFVSHMDDYLDILHGILENKDFEFDEYHYFQVKEGIKIRDVCNCDIFPNKVVHHAIMNICLPMFMGMFVDCSYASIKDKGQLKCSKRLRKDLAINEEGTKYCLKIDIKKYYDNIDHDILKSLIRKKIKDKDALWLYDLLIDTTDKGLPLGNYTSQILANFYLTYFDYYVKSTLGVKYYYRYCDDMVFLGSNKEYLHEILDKVEIYLRDELKLTIKENKQIFPVEDRGIDFVGYVHKHHNVRLRRRIFKTALEKIEKHKTKKLSKKRFKQLTAPYYGWFKYSYNRKTFFEKIKEIKK